MQVKVNKKIEDEKKLKSEITHLETVSSSVESDLSSCISEKAALEHQVHFFFLFFIFYINFITELERTGL